MLFTALRCFRRAVQQEQHYMVSAVRATHRVVRRVAQNSTPRVWLAGFEPAISSVRGRQGGQAPSQPVICPLRRLH